MVNFLILSFAPILIWNNIWRLESASETFLQTKSIVYNEESNLLGCDTTSTRCHIPEDCFLHSYRRENLKSYIVCIMYRMIIIKLIFRLTNFYIWQVCAWIFLKVDSRYSQNFLRTKEVISWVTQKTSSRGTILQKLRFWESNYIHHNVSKFANVPEQFFSYPMSVLRPCLRNINVTVAPYGSRGNFRKEILADGYQSYNSSIVSVL
jgi:hypothetical protein